MKNELLKKSKLPEQLMEFNEFKDERGALVALEAFNNIPFDIKRVFYIYHTKPDLPRGFHAMEKALQVLVCVSGSCDVILDDGDEKRKYHLNALNQGLFIDNLIWHEMKNMTEDCILMVLINEPYREEDNLRSYEKFKQIKASQK